MLNILLVSGSNSAPCHLLAFSGTKPCKSVISYSETSPILIILPLALRSVSFSF